MYASSLLFGLLILGLWLSGHHQRPNGQVGGIDQPERHKHAHPVPLLLQDPVAAVAYMMKVSKLHLLLCEAAHGLGAGPALVLIHQLKCVLADTLTLCSYSLTLLQQCFNI